VKAHLTGAINPVNPVKKKEIKDRIHSALSILVGEKYYG
jgi:hypothetical protein